MTEPRQAEPASIEFGEFLESSPPGTSAVITEIIVFDRFGRPSLITPGIQLHCDHDSCTGIRFFHCVEGDDHVDKNWGKTFLTYKCRNCGKTSKTFAILHRLTNGSSGEAYKLGEIPPFGPPLPSRVVSLVGPDRELFIRGRRAENQGLGIGAFGYYRRVVENQWRRFIDEIVKVSKRIGAPSATVVILETAAKETQFSKAVDAVKDAIPGVLLVDNHNPITLLYKALSEGLHEKSEEHCLELASSIRIVLTELAERISQALKDERELKDAVTRLLHRGDK